MVKVIYDDQLVYKVVIWVFFGISLWTEKVALRDVGTIFFLAEAGTRAGNVSAGKFLLKSIVIWPDDIWPWSS